VEYLIQYRVLNSTEGVQIITTQSEEEAIAIAKSLRNILNLDYIYINKIVYDRELTRQIF
jgi:hypothetical protein